MIVQCVQKNEKMRECVNSSRFIGNLWTFIPLSLKYEMPSPIAWIFLLKTVPQFHTGFGGAEPSFFGIWLFFVNYLTA
jgi:hypothetical protein